MAMPYFKSLSPERAELFPFFQKIRKENRKAKHNKLAQVIHYKFQRVPLGLTYGS